MSKTYTPDELAELLTFGNAYIKMVLKKIEGYEPGKPVTEEVAARLAAKVNRPWPPQGAQKNG